MPWYEKAGYFTTGALVEYTRIFALPSIKDPKAEDKPNAALKYFYYGEQFTDNVLSFLGDTVNEDTLLSMFKFDSSNAVETLVMVAATGQLVPVVGTAAVSLEGVAIAGAAIFGGQLLKAIADENKTARSNSLNKSEKVKMLLRLRRILVWLLRK